MKKFVVVRVLDVCSLFLNQKRNSVNAEARYPQLQPESDDFRNLLAHLLVVCVQVRLEVIKAVKIELLGLAVSRPRALLHAREDHARVVILWPLVSPHIPVMEWRPRTISGQ